MQDTKAEKAFIITGPTSGIGYQTALSLAKHGTVVLVGRNKEKLDQVQKVIHQSGGEAISVVCDLADLESVRRAAEEIQGLRMLIAGLLNNAGVMVTKKPERAEALDRTFVTNHLAPFALTDLLVPHLPDGANIVFVASAIEDPERRPAKLMGIRGGRFISVEASARGQWEPGGSKLPGMDAYATSKQCILASTFAFAREMPRLHFNAVEPGINPNTGLGGAPLMMRLVFGQVVTRLPPFSKYRSTPEQAAKIIAKVVVNTSGATGVYYDEKRRPMMGSQHAHDPIFQDRVVSETRAFLTSLHH